MKTAVIKLAAFTMIFSISFAAFAGKNNLKAGITLKTNETIEIRVDKAGSETISLNVYNEVGERVFEKSFITGKGIRINHDISGFPNGIYTYEVIDNTEVVYSARILKSSDNSLEYRGDSYGTLASVSQRNTDNVLVRLSKKDSERTRIKVADNAGRVLYSRYLSEPGNYMITHDIKAFPEGDYTFSISNGKEMIAYRKISR